MYITPKIGQNIYYGPIIYKIQKKTLSSFALKKSTTIIYVIIIVIINHLYKNKFSSQKDVSMFVRVGCYLYSNHRERKSTYSVFLQKGVSNFVLKS